MTQVTRPVRTRVRSVRDMRVSLPQLKQVEYGALVIDAVVSGKPLRAFFDGTGRAPQGAYLCNRWLNVIHPVGQHHTRSVRLP